MVIDLNWEREANLQNKFDKIKLIGKKHKPSILGLSEANLKANVGKRIVELEDYQMHTAPTIDNLNLKISRMVVYTNKKDNLVIKRRHDLKDENLSAIWMEVSHKRKEREESIGGRYLKRIAVS